MYLYHWRVVISELETEEQIKTERLAHAPFGPTNLSPLISVNAIRAFSINVFRLDRDDPPPRPDATRTRLGRDSDATRSAVTGSHGDCLSSCGLAPLPVNPLAILASTPGGDHCRVAKVTRIWGTGKGREKRFASQCRPSLRRTRVVFSSPLNACTAALLSNEIGDWRLGMGMGMGMGMGTLSRP
jgi:hypothetical protein